MTYDSWKTRAPEWDGPEPESDPEVFENCPECCGEGSIEEWETVSKWSIDPPCAHVKTCPNCGGARGMICEPTTDLTIYDLDERCGA